MGLAPGTRIGACEVTGTLGAGGMGEVYRARDTRLGRDVAIKVLLPAVANDADRLTRFAREAQVLAALNHPNIAAIYGFEDSADTRALVMELVDGPTLADRIARGPLPIKEALSIARQIADALEAAHEQGIVHRDLKPANIKVKDDGTVKVLDFGLAKAMDPAATSSVNIAHSPTISFHATQAGIILGTAAYMSPEQAAGKPVDKRTDLWAFGVVLFEMLTGRRLFDGETISHVIAAVLTKEPDWAALPAAVPVQVRKLLQRCLAKERKARLADAADARFELDEALTAPTSGMTPATAARPQRLWLAMAAAVIAGAMMGVAGSVAFRAPDPAPVVTSLELSTPETSAPSNFAISPDGRHIAFVAGTPPQLWVRSLAQPESRSLPGTDGAEYPFWAPDSRRVAFFAGGKLKGTDIDGQVPLRTLADAPAGTGGTWNADDDIVFSFIGSPLLKVPARGGAVVPITRVTSTQRGHGWPQFLPDGRHLLFLTVVENFLDNLVSVTAIDTGEIRELFVSLTGARYARPGYLLRLAQQGLIAQRFDPSTAVVSGESMAIGVNLSDNDGRLNAAFSVSDAGTLIYRTGATPGREMAWLEGSGKRIAVVTPPEIVPSPSVSLSPDGTRVAYGRFQQGSNDIWLSRASDPVPSRFTFHKNVDLAPIWSPDGQRIMFASQRSLPWFDLFVKPSTGAGEEQLFLGSAEIKMPLDWSHDGRYVLYSTFNEKTLRDLWAVGTGDDRKAFPVLQGSSNEGEGQFAPSGRWLAYTSDESGRDEVYVRTFPEPAGKWQVSTNGGDQPRWSADGKTLFFVEQGSALMRTPVAVAADGGSVAIGAPARLFSAPIPRRTSIGTATRYSVSADGRFLMMLDAGASEASAIQVVLNWTAALSGR